MKSITIEGQLRSEFGKKATRQVRSEGQVPCVIYGGAETVNFSAPATSFKNLIYTPDFQLAEIKLGAKTYRCVLKDKQFDTVTDELAHIDFLELVEDKPVAVTLPIRITGQSEGVKAGGKLVVKIKALKVKALPKHLRENIEVNIDKLELNGNIRVEDVVAENIEILNSPRIPIASVVMTRQLRQEEAQDAKKK
ncbi:50S ribosomal protein L25/general stress protein Ctc [Chitinophaga sp. S165]|uniref:50S ribosomal protein L25/general stress protein Ctc n=1 Tax=Chitinophaga sp. S165 TaxID=2135462 RepID=UPI000D70EF01|nr:50S ribosomal protein L25/general stress protein Ctc [Chitinophaga sp. S165]PWV45161.1 LSU ribosomal protein L25P [Chitinophaga sp. S165]